VYPGVCDSNAAAALINAAIDDASGPHDQPCANKANSAPSSCFHKLSTDLLVLVSQHLHFRELAELARGNRLLGSIMSLNINHPSPALQRRQVLRVRFTCRLDSQQLSLFFRCFGNLQSASLSLRQFPELDASSIQALIEATGHSLRSLQMVSEDSVPAVSKSRALSTSFVGPLFAKCSNLVSLRLHWLEMSAWPPVLEPLPNLRELYLPKLPPHAGETSRVFNHTSRHRALPKASQRGSGIRSAESGLLPFAFCADSR